MAAAAPVAPPSELSSCLEATIEAFRAVTAAAGEAAARLTVGAPVNVSMWDRAPEQINAVLQGAVLRSAGEVALIVGAEGVIQPVDPHSGSPLGLHACAGHTRRRQPGVAHTG